MVFIVYQAKIRDKEEIVFGLLHGFHEIEHQFYRGN